MEVRSALIIGASGQDGTYLARLLVKKGYTVFGIGSGLHARVPEMRYKMLDIRDARAFCRYLEHIQPDEVYHLAAYHRSSSAQGVSISKVDEEHAFLETNFLSTHTLLRTLCDTHKSCRVFLAGSCHMFGNAKETPQNEQTPFAPSNMYGVTKVASAHLGHLFRDQERLFVCTGILYNHESPLRGPEFITSRIVRTALRIKQGKEKELVIGNLDALVDWGFAGDYVEAMWHMLQAEAPKDYIVSSGEYHRVRDFVDMVFRRVGVDPKLYVREDRSLVKPVGIALYQGDSSLIQRELGWKPKTSFQHLVDMMVDAALEKEKDPCGSGNGCYGEKSSS